MCNYSSLVFTSLDPDPYGHFSDPGSGSGSAWKLMQIRKTAAIMSTFEQSPIKVLQYIRSPSCSCWPLCFHLVIARTTGSLCPKLIKCGKFQSNCFSLSFAPQMYTIHCIYSIYILSILSEQVNFILLLRNLREIVHKQQRQWYIAES